MQNKENQGHKATYRRPAAGMGRRYWWPLAVGLYEIAFSLTTAVDVVCLTNKKLLIVRKAFGIGIGFKPLALVLQLNCF